MNVMITLEFKDPIFTTATADHRLKFGVVLLTLTGLPVVTGLIQI